MKGKKLKILALSCALCGFLTAGLLPARRDAAAATEPPNTMEEFTIAGFVNYYDFEIASLEDQTRELARSGINWIDTPHWYTSKNRNLTNERTNPSLTDWGAFNELCRELNIYFSMQKEGQLVMDEASIAQAVQRAQGLDRCIGYYLKDEPSSAQIPAIADLFRKLLEADGTRFPYVNLFPNYAGASNLGGSYEDYVRQWVAAAGPENLEYLYFDHYPFTAFEDVRASYFSDVETIRKVAYENGKLKTGGYTQMGWWNGMRRPTPEETRWDMNSLLAYGMKSISHFTWVSPNYVEPPSGEGMMDFVLTNEGEPTDRYEPMQRLNWQTRQLGPLLMNIDVAHAYHAGEVPVGTESLPKNFLMQPSSSKDNLLFSLAYAKDSPDVYLMLFNKELSGEQTYTIETDPDSGLTGLTWYRPDDFATLPDYTKPLAPPEEIEIDTSEGDFTVTIGAGEMRLYKLNGNVTIKEPLKGVQTSHRSGSYVGEQSVELFCPDRDAEIFYTTDGTYPTYRSERYDGPIRIGRDGETSFHTIKAISVRKGEETEAITSELFLSDASRNVAQGIPASFVHADGSPAETASWQGNGTPESVTDGSFDPFNTFGSVQGKPCFAVVDFGKAYQIDRVTVKAWHDWRFDDVIVQLATLPDFSDAYTVYNSDRDNSLGLGAGTDVGESEGYYLENPAMGHIFRLSEPVTARYIRFHNVSVQDHRRWSLFEEIAAYTAFREGTALSEDAANWKVTGGGTWTHEGGTITRPGTADREGWDRSYTYTAGTFKNFILEGTFTMRTDDPGAWGYAGFGLYKKRVNSVQSEYDSGIYAVIEPKGRALLWNGAKPELGPDNANIPGFALNAPFQLRVVSVGSYLTMSVNNRSVLSVRLDTLDRAAGYLSIQSGLIPLEVSDVRIVELDEGQDFVRGQEAITDFEEVKVAVERFQSLEDVLAKLPQTLQVRDTSGRLRDAKVKWNCDLYDSTATGFVKFTGRFVELPEGLVNARGVLPEANVFFKPYVDKTDLEELVARAESLNERDFTAESWAQMLIKFDAAKALLADPFLVQNDIGVGVWQLYDELYKNLVSTLDRSMLEQELEAAEDLNLSEYTEISGAALRAAVEEGKLVSADQLATREEIFNAAERIASARRALAEPVKAVGAGEAPEPTPVPGDGGWIAATASGAAAGAAGAGGIVGCALAFKKKKRKVE